MESNVRKRTSINEFATFTQGQIARMQRIGRPRTAEKYAIAIRSFMRFRKDKDVFLKEINSNLMMEYEMYLKSQGVCPNTSSFYLRNLRAIYNRAVDQRLTAQRHPFKYVYTGVDKTEKRALPLKTIRRLNRLDLSATPLLEWARDMFLFSFFTRGMSCVDLAFLRKKDLRNGFLSYRRRKTDQQLFIRWEAPMQAIVKKYDTGDSPYLLPIIRKPGKDEWKQYISAYHLINKKLKIIGAELGLSIPLTTYVARHSWASIAKSKNIPIGVISEAMGHDSEKTTQIYLTSLDSSQVDGANSLILNSL